MKRAAENITKMTQYKILLIGQYLFFLQWSRVGGWHQLSSPLREEQTQGAQRQALKSCQANM